MADSEVKKQQGFKEMDFGVTGMTCAACAQSLTSWLSSQDGVNKADVNYANHNLRIEFDPDIINARELDKAARQIGYGIVSEEILEEEEQKRYKELRIKLIFSLLLSIPVFVISMSTMDPAYNLLFFMLTLPVISWSGSEFFVKAWAGLKNGKSNMDTLVALSTGIAFLFSSINTFFPEWVESMGVTPHVYFESVVVILSLILLGRFLEARAKRKTNESLKMLMGLQVKTATLFTDGNLQSVNISDLLPGQLVLVKAGEKIPVDGKVVEGTSFIDESMITGEPLAVETFPGKVVKSGTINQKGILKIEVQKTGKDTLLSHIIALVKRAQASKPPIQYLVDKIASIFVPIVIGIGLLTFLSWWWLGTLSLALITTVSVLIIACPCALGLATPTALIVGMGKGAEKGILIRDAESLQIAHNVTDIVLDKTGTLTQGKARVNQIFWDPEADRSKMTSILYNLEALSEHPLSEPILQFLEHKRPKKLELEAITSVTGKGIQGKHEGIHYVVGSERMMLDRGIPFSEYIKAKAFELQSEANTVVYFSDQDRIQCILSISDQVKTEAPETIESMENYGLKVHMLTGDNFETAHSIASQLSIKHFRARLLPQDKVQYIEKLQAGGSIVAMIGDGINDAPALTAADLGISLSTGSDLAIESAHITLLNGDISRVLTSLELSSATMKTIRQNLFWAFIYNIIAIPIAAGIFYPINGFLLDPMIAGAAMAFSSLSVVGNSLRLKKFNPKHIDQNS